MKSLKYHQEISFLQNWGGGGPLTNSTREFPLLLCSRLVCDKHIPRDKSNLLQKWTKDRCVGLCLWRETLEEKKKIHVSKQSTTLQKIKKKKAKLEDSLKRSVSKTKPESPGKGPPLCSAPVRILGSHLGLQVSPDRFLIYLEKKVPKSHRSVASPKRRRE